MTEERIVGELSAILTATSILWTLQTILVWRAIDQGKGSKILGWALMITTLAATASVGAALVGLRFVSRGAEDPLFRIAYQSAFYSALVLVAVVFVYYALVIAAFIKRPTDH